MRSQDIPTTPDGRRAWLQFQLRMLGYTFGQLAREFGLERGTVRRALWRPYPRMEQIIADKLGIPAQMIWPERYDANGNPTRCPHADSLPQHSASDNPKDTKHVQLVTGAA